MLLIDVGAHRAIKAELDIDLDDINHAALKSPRCPACGGVEVLNY